MRWRSRAGAKPRRGSISERVPAGFDGLRQRRRFAMLTEPSSVPVAELALVRHAPLTVPRSAR
jgi:hypothetical protein